MALVVRNTFLTISQQEDDDQHAGRSNSAPPTCRHAKRDEGDYNFMESVEPDKSCNYFTVENVEPDKSTMVPDSDDAASLYSYMTEHESVTPAMSRDDVDSDADTDVVAPDPSVVSAQQQQLEQMSQMVMDLWSKLRSVESSIEAKCRQEAAIAEVPSQVAQVPAPPQSTSSKLASTAKPFVPTSCGPSEIQSSLTLVAQQVKSAHGVMDVDVNLGLAGTLATITVTTLMLDKSAVTTASKSALLEVAERSKSTYVLGYETTPFQDNPDGSGFFCTFASMPVAWECSACWDTYTMGFCPRKRTCKWQHPGRTELQPVRVVVQSPP
jgi:hypothetical protein